MDVIRDNAAIRTLLKQRLSDLGVSYRMIIKDAESKRFTGLTKGNLSRYFSGKEKGIITQEQLLWICVRYGVTFHIKVSRLVEYKESECITNLINMFYGGKEPKPY